jgi:hypothetical protein
LPHAFRIGVHHDTGAGFLQDEPDVAGVEFVGEGCSLFDGELPQVE